MGYTLTGFTQDKGFRVFGFERREEDQSRTAFTVRADLSLIRTYGIRVQELPLLCRAVLERGIEGESQRAWTFTEEEMGAYAKTSLERSAAARKRTPPRKPATENLGAAWRVPQPQQEGPAQ